MTEKKLEELIEYEKYRIPVMNEYMSCRDLEVLKWFNMNSKKNMKLKYKVLKQINNGKEPNEKEFYKILDNYPRDKNGKIIPQ